MGNHQAPPALQQQFLCFQSTEHISAPLDCAALVFPTQTPASSLPNPQLFPARVNEVANSAVPALQDRKCTTASERLAAPVSWWVAGDVMQRSSSPHQHPGGAREAEAQLHRKVLASPGVRSPSPRAYCLYKAGRDVKLEGKIAHRVFKLLFEVMYVPVMLLLHLFNGHFCLYAHV